MVNPQRLSSSPPYSTCAAWVAHTNWLKNCTAGLERLQELDRDLDLVALGTIADLASSREQSLPVWKGLQEIRNTQRPALSAILETTNTKPDDLTEEQISFLLAPRFERFGRLGDANPIVEFFQTADMEQARVFAMQLEGSTPAGNALRPGFPGRPDSNREQPGWLDLPSLS